MKITGNMKIKEVLALDENLMNTLILLAPEFERLQYPKLRRAMSGRVSVAQAARVAKLPLTEVLYVLNLAIGEDEELLSKEIRQMSKSDDYSYRETNPPTKPREIRELKDDDSRIVYVDLMTYAEARVDPMPAIAKGLVNLMHDEDVLLLRHPFDPIPLRDLLARRGFASWAEERKSGVWYIYFYRPSAAANVIAHPPIPHEVFKRAAGAG